MHAARYARPRRCQRRIRVVSAQANMRPSPVVEADVQAYAIGLECARHLARLFPAWHAQHAAHRRVTLPQLAALASAFLGLVNDELFPLEVYDSSIAPALDAGTAINDLTPWAGDMALHALLESERYLAQPAPVFYGLGVQSYVEGYEDMTGESPDALTMAIWTMFRNTGWSIGYDLHEMIEELSPAEQAALEALRPLPSYANVDDLLAALDPATRIGIRYAYGRTDVALADASIAEIEYLYMDEIDDTWDDAVDIARQSTLARQISCDYSAWLRRMIIDPGATCTQLQDALWKALEQQDATPDPRSLMKLLGMDDLDIDAVELEAV